MSGVLGFLTSPAFSARVQSVMSTHHVPGMAVALLDHGHIASAGFGLSSIDPPRNCTPDTLFDIASSSKSMTVGALGVLLTGELHPTITFQTPVREILGDDFIMAQKEYSDQITIDDIISHRTGLTAHDLSYFGPNATGPDRPDSAISIVRNLRNLPLTAALRSKFYYNNIMYTVASHVVEVLSSTSFKNFLETTFFKPLDMRHTSLQPSSAISKGFKRHMASGYVWRKREKTYSFGFPPVDTPEGQGAGSIITSANDYIKWVKAILYREQPITAKVYDEFLRPRTCQDADALKMESCETMYAGGFDVYKYRDHQIVSHAGSVSGFGSFHFFVPDLEFAGVFTGNVGNADEAAQKLANELIDYILDDKKATKSVEGDEGDGRKRLAAQRNVYNRDILETQRSNLQSQVERSKGHPQTKPLADYVGLYKNTGYHDMEVTVKKGRLYIDAGDRSFGTMFTFHHLANNTDYAVSMRSSRRLGSENLGFVHGQFEFGEKCTSRMGLQLDDDYGKLIWFDRI
ncbi:hypothetical protein VHEMI09261 [[Torrubiella] hemipterigena]|uniref:Beta-lactamase family protein n=1 Tax=[Torrubiella] hemipterigena TaxID=1531966 RepID=A0A0A1TQ30_9HYPO|nr:hypothetical protein VHEMI09261 [[Torrubiella] hemipterigena]